MLLVLLIDGRSRSERNARVSFAPTSCNSGINILTGCPMSKFNWGFFDDTSKVVPPCHYQSIDDELFISLIVLFKLCI